LVEAVNEDDREAIWEKAKEATTGKRIVPRETGIQIRHASDVSWEH